MHLMSWDWKYKKIQYLSYKVRRKISRMMMLGAGGVELFC